MQDRRQVCIHDLSLCQYALFLLDNWRTSHFWPTTDICCESSRKHVTRQVHTTISSSSRIICVTHHWLSHALVAFAFCNNITYIRWGSRSWIRKKVPAAPSQTRTRPWPPSQVIMLRFFRGWFVSATKPASQPTRNLFSMYGSCYWGNICSMLTLFYCQLVQTQKKTVQAMDHLWFLHAHVTCCMVSWS
jgi:hypothetical protein